MEGDRTDRWLATSLDTYHKISLPGTKAYCRGPPMYPYTYRQPVKFTPKPPISYIAKELLKLPASYIPSEPKNLPISYIPRQPMMPPSFFSLKELLKPPPSYSPRESMMPPPIFSSKEPLNLPPSYIPMEPLKRPPSYIPRTLMMPPPFFISREPMKPPFSYVALAALALCHSGQAALPINQIYSFIRERFPYYRRHTGRWQNSLRHCLSYNDCFVKVSRAPGLPGRGALWSLHPGARDMFTNGSLLRRRNKFTLNQEEKERAGLQIGTKGPEKMSFSISRLLDLEPAGTSISRPWTGTHTQHYATRDTPLSQKQSTLQSMK